MTDGGTEQAAPTPPAAALLACPECGASGLRAEPRELRCGQCGRAYPMLRDAIDFRDFDKDQTAGFSLTDDLKRARLLDAVFDELPTFMQLARVFYAIERKEAEGVALDSIDPHRLVREENLLEPEPMTPWLLGHGAAILEKVPAYLEGTGYPGLPSGIALEAGCGQALYVDAFARHFEHLVVLDISMVYLMLARKIMEERGLTNVTLACATAERMPFLRETFDFVHNNNVIEHVTDQPGLLAELRRVAKRTGLVFIMSPNRYSIYVEPHFKLPAFGFIPKPIRRRIIRRTQKREIENVGLLSLREFSGMVRREFPRHAFISFIPRRIKRTATGGLIRSTLRVALGAPGAGAAVNLLVNRLALGVMPYHCAICWEETPAAPSPSAQRVSAASRP
jgi:SAM-dependent methyltransferase